MTIARKFLRGYAERILRTGSRIRIGGRDIVPLDDYEGGETREIGFAQCLVPPITLNIHKAY